MNKKQDFTKLKNTATHPIDILDHSTSETQGSTALFRQSKTSPGSSKNPANIPIKSGFGVQSESINYDELDLDPDLDLSIETLENRSHFKGKEVCKKLKHKTE